MSIQLRLEYLLLIVPALVLWSAIVFTGRHRLISFFNGYRGYLCRLLRFTPEVWLMAIPIVWLGATHHFEFDEARTFLSFSSRSILRAMAYYPSPNNHVLHSILSNITWHLLAWTNSELSVRLTAILFSLLTAAFVSNVFLKGNRVLTLLFITVLFLSDSFFSLSFQARSYSMQSFFAVAGLSAVMGTGMGDATTGRRWAALVLSCILGTYSSPAFLYTAFPLACMFIVRERGWIKDAPMRFLTIALAGATTVILLYSPILLIESAKAVTSNKYVKPYVYFMTDDFLRHCSRVAKWVILPGAAGFIFLALTCIHALRRKRYEWLLVVLCPILLMRILRQMPEARIFQPVGVIILVLGLLCLAEWIGSGPFKPWATASCFALLATTVVYRLRTADEMRNLSANRTYGVIEKHLPKEGENYLLETQWLYYDPLLAYSKVKGREYIQLPDTTTRLPSTGMLVTGRRIPGLRCADSIVQQAMPDLGTLYIYSLDGRRR